MEEALRARLLSSAAVADLTGIRIDWIERPQADGLPGMTLQIVGGNLEYNYDGRDELESPRIQFDCWGRSPKEARDLARAAMAAIEPPATVGGVRFGGAFVEIVNDFPPEEMAGGVKVFRRSFDATVWWKEV